MSQLDIISPKTCKPICHLTTVNSLYEEPWWLDAVAPGRWSEVCIRNNREVIARMPYVFQKKYGLPTIGMPPFTQALGPWIRPSTAKHTNQLAEQKELIRELVRQLPKVDMQHQFLTPNLTNWLPFHWEGFHQTTRYTYRIDDLSDLDTIWWSLRENIRREVRKAEKHVIMRDDLGLERFIEVNNLTFQRQGMKLPYDVNLIRRVDDACASRGQRKILFAEDSRGNIHAAAYLVWDAESAYYILGGADPELRSSGAGSLVIWTAIQTAAEVTKCFDFKGSMIESVERFNRSFGARLVPYHEVTRMSHRMNMLRGLRDAISAPFRF